MQPNLYLRSLNAMPPPEDFEYPMWKEEGDILITPDGYRWRIERSPTVGDLVKTGSLIQTYMDGKKWGGPVRVAKVIRIVQCCCPVTGFSHKYCTDGDMRYHREVIHWTIVYVPLDAIPNKDHTYSERHFLWANDLVALNGKMVQLFADDNDDWVEIVETPKKLKGKLSPVQPGFW